jgi:hypothetical protein
VALAVAAQRRHPRAEVEDVEGVQPSLTPWHGLHVCRLSGCNQHTDLTFEAYEYCRLFFRS